MVEHGFNHVEESPTPSRGRFLEVLGLGLLALGGGLLADRLWPDAPAQPVAPNAPARPAAPADADDDDDGQEPDR
jgi:hypothetical protein